MDPESRGGPRREFELIKDSSGEYRWRLQSGNNRIIADSGEGYSSKSAAEEGIADVRRIAPTPCSFDQNTCTFP